MFCFQVHSIGFGLGYVNRKFFIFIVNYKMHQKKCHNFDLLTCCKRLGLTYSAPGVDDIDKGPKGRNRLLGVRLLGVTYEVLCSVSLASSPSLFSSSLPLELRLNGS